MSHPTCFTSTSRHILPLPYLTLNTATIRQSRQKYVYGKLLLLKISKLMLIMKTTVGYINCLSTFAHLYKLTYVTLEILQWCHCTFQWWHFFLNQEYWKILRPMVMVKAVEKIFSLPENAAVTLRPLYWDLCTFHWWIFLLK